MDARQRTVIIGSSGGIGKAMVSYLSHTYPDATIYAFSRNGASHGLDNVIHHTIDILDEASIEQAAQFCSCDGTLNKVIVASGLLHNETIAPEKSLRDVSMKQFQEVFAVNTFGVALVAKHFLKQLDKENTAYFAALSARVGSIGDNRLGGWYAYRASKAALNMVIKNAAIEMGRRYRKAVIVGLHPGTVDSNLSAPFQSQVQKDTLFTPAYAAERLVTVLEGLTPHESGKCFAWDGKEIAP